MYSLGFSLTSVDSNIHIEFFSFYDEAKKYDTYVAYLLIRTYR